MDDDSDFRKVTRLSLSIRGYKVLEASSGREAISLARQVQPDLILLDVLMPGLDGYEACRQIKTNPATSHIPIIVLTAVGVSASVSRFSASHVCVVRSPVGDCCSSRFPVASYVYFDCIRYFR